MKKKMILVITMVVFALSGCGSEDKNADKQNTATLTVQEISKTENWETVETSLEGSEDRNVAAAFLEWVLGRYNAEDWDALVAKLSSSDEDIFMGLTDVVSQMRVAKKNFNYTPYESISLYEIKDEETSEILGWEMQYSTTANPGESDEAYEEGSIYAYVEDGNWVWSIIPIEFSNHTDDMQDSYEVRKAEFEQERQEAMEKQAESMKQMQEDYQQSVDEMNETYEQNVQQMMENYNQNVQQMQEQHNQNTQRMLEMQEQNMQEMMGMW